MTTCTELYKNNGMSSCLSACAKSVYQALFLLPLESLGTRLLVIHVHGLRGVVVGTLISQHIGQAQLIIAFTLRRLGEIFTYKQITSKPGSPNKILVTCIIGNGASRITVMVRQEQLVSHYTSRCMHIPPPPLQ